MQWSSHKNAGFSEGEPWINVVENYETINVESEIKCEESVYAFYKKLINLRKEKDIISEGSIEFIEKDNEDVLAYKREYDNDEIVVLNNLTDGNVVIKMQQEWFKYHKLIGNYQDEKTDKDSGEIVLRPYETVCLEK